MGGREGGMEGREGGDMEIKIERGRESERERGVMEREREGGGVRVRGRERESLEGQAFRQYFKGQQKRERPLKRWSHWSDQIRNDTGLPLLMPERRALNKAGRSGTTEVLPTYVKSSKILQYVTIDSC